MCDGTVKSWPPSWSGPSDRCHEAVDGVLRTFAERWAIMRECRSRPTARSAIRCARPSPSAARDERRPPSGLRRPASRRPPASTTTSGSSGTAPSRAGPCRRASRCEGRAPSGRARRGPPARLRRLRGEIPAGQYGAGTVEIWDRGTYELLEEKRDGGLTVRASRRAARRERGRSYRPRLDGERPQNWLLLRKDAGGDARSVATGRCSRRRRAAARGRGVAVRAEMGRLSGARHVDGGESTSASRNDNDLTERFRGRRARAAARACARPSACSTARSAPSTRTGRSGFGLLQQGAGQLVFVAFDVLELDGEPLVDRPLVERRERLEQLVDPRSAACSSRPAFDDGAALLAGRAGARSRRRGRQAHAIALPAGPAHRRTGAR